MRRYIGITGLKTHAIPVIAGGLSGENVSQIVGFFRKEYGDNFSIDSEGRLREIPEELSKNLSKKYIENAWNAYRWEK